MSHVLSTTTSIDTMAFRYQNQNDQWVSFQIIVIHSSVSPDLSIAGSNNITF